MNPGYHVSSDLPRCYRRVWDSVSISLYCPARKRTAENGAARPWPSQKRECPRPWTPFNNRGTSVTLTVTFRLFWLQDARRRSCARASPDHRSFQDVTSYKGGTRDQKFQVSLISSSNFALGSAGLIPKRHTRRFTNRFVRHLRLHFRRIIIEIGD